MNVKQEASHFVVCQSQSWVCFLLMVIQGNF